MSTWHAGQPTVAGTYYLCIERQGGSSEVVVAYYDPARPERSRITAWTEYRAEWVVDAEAYKSPWWVD